MRSTPILGHPALRLLARRKARGMWRKQWRRLKTPKGLLFTLFGLAVFGTWIASIIASASSRRFAPPTAPLPDELVPRAIGLGGVILLMSGLASALSIRGLYLPKEEIELLFSAPLTRSDIIRYRLRSNLWRSAFGGVIAAFFVSSHMPNHVFAFLGTWVGIATQPLLAQWVSLLAGDAENRAYSRLPKFLTRIINVVLAATVGLFFASFLMRGAINLDRFAGFNSTVEEVLRKPWMEWVALPFTPWARAITAESAAEFVPWFVACIAIGILIFESAARTRVDFRELSLETSADIARRLNRFRSGAGGASASRARKSPFGWSAPWWLGRGAVGAVAWRKSNAILRKARGTFITSGVILGFVVFLVSSIASKPGGSRPDVLAAVMISGIGTLYLCMGLRFDFRDDLEQMEMIKAWPVAPWKIFLATIVPEVMLVWILCGTAVLARAIFLHQLSLAVIGCVAALPLVVFTWLAVDNAVFLFAPIRYVAGQDGALQNAGRAVLTIFLRFGVFLFAIALILTGAAAAYGLGYLLGWETSTWVLLAGALSLVSFVGVNAFVVALGGYLLQRFDVARDRG